VTTNSVGLSEPRCWFVSPVEHPPTRPTHRAKGMALAEATTHALAMPMTSTCYVCAAWVTANRGLSAAIRRENRLDLRLR